MGCLTWRPLSLGLGFLSWELSCGNFTQPDPAFPEIPHLTATAFPEEGMGSAARLWVVGWGETVAGFPWDTSTIQ